MLAASARMRASEDFRATVRQGVRAARPTVVVHARTVASPPSSKSAVVGFVVSKAVGNAVTRNRVKRRLRHLARPLAEQAAGHQVVVRALPEAALAGPELADQFGAAWAKALDRADRVRPGREPEPRR